MKEIIELVLAKVPEDKKEAFLAEVSDKNVKKDAAFLEKYGVKLTAEELEAITSDKITDADLDEVAGGCMCCCAPCADCIDVHARD